MGRKSTFPFELIGEEIEVVAATNSSLQGVRGKVIDETRNTLVVLQGAKTQRMLKQGITFRLCRTKQIIDGASILKRPEERIKG